MEEHWFYRLYEEKHVENSHSGYGIALYCSNRTVKIIGDVSVDRDAVERLARIFNEEELDPVHFEQAVEDFLYDNSV